MRVSTSIPTVHTEVVVADRSPHFRETLRRVLALNPGTAVVAEAGTLHDALRLVRQTGARFVILDIQLVMNQPAARLRRIVERLPGLQVVILLDEDLPGYRRAIAQRWGYACVAKESVASELPGVLPTAARKALRH